MRRTEGGANYIALWEGFSSFVVFVVIISRRGRSEALGIHPFILFLQRVAGSFCLGLFECGAVMSRYEVDAYTKVLMLGGGKTVTSHSD
jgi:hypothetical protein